MVVFAAHLASQRLGRVEQKKPPPVQKYSMSRASSVGQNQDVLF
jgi:hypothetical protein